MPSPTRRATRRSQFLQAAHDDGFCRDRRRGRDRARCGRGRNAPRHRLPPSTPASKMHRTAPSRSSPPETEAVKHGRRDAEIESSGEMRRRTRPRAMNTPTGRCRRRLADRRTRGRRQNHQSAVLQLQRHAGANVENAPQRPLARKSDGRCVRSPMTKPAVADQLRAPDTLLLRNGYWSESVAWAPRQTRVRLQSIWCVARATRLTPSSRSAAGRVIAIGPREVAVLLEPPLTWNTRLVGPKPGPT